MDAIFDTRYIVALGAANLDIAATSTQALAQGDSIPGNIRSACGGVARNISENLARLGHDVRLMSVVGDDLFGRSIIASTQAAGVCTDAVHILAAGSTSTYLSLHGADGDMSVALNDMEILRRLDPLFLQGHLSLLTGAAAVVVDCNLSEEALQWLFASSVSAPLFFDGVSVTKCQRLKRYLSRIHMLKVNLLEAQALTGIEITSPQDALVAAKNLAELGVGCGVVSLGRQGIAWWDAAGNVGLREGRKMEVVSTSGAGDALLSGLIHGFMAAAPFTHALNFGLRCAEFTLSSPHANHPGLSLHSLTNGAIPQKASCIC